MVGKDQIGELKYRDLLVENAIVMVVIEGSVIGLSSVIIDGDI